MMRKLLLSVLPLAAIVLFTSEKMSDNGKAGKTGSPGETNCTSCHSDFTVNTGGGSVILTSTNMTGWEYLPNTTYHMTVTVSRATDPLFGIGLECLDGTNNNAGTLVITDAASSQIKNATVSGVSRHNVVHQLNGGATTGSKAFDFDWTSPATNVGTVTFYFAGVAADANGNEGGDYVYTGTQAVAPNTVGITELSAGGAYAFPNPASEFINVTYKSVTSGTVVMNLYDLTGKLVQKISSSQQPGMHTETFRNLDLYPNGIYLLQTIVDGTAKTQKVIIQ